jgi:dynactin complex subunit
VAMVRGRHGFNTIDSIYYYKSRAKSKQEIRDCIKVIKSRPKLNVQISLNLIQEITQGMILSKIIYYNYTFKTKILDKIFFNSIFWIGTMINFNHKSD